MDPFQFRQPVDGPELVVERAIHANLQSLFFSPQSQFWIGRYMPLGAGRPDIIAAAFHARVVDLADTDQTCCAILAYLRRINSARLLTIADRLRLSEREARRSVDCLSSIGALVAHSSSFRLAPHMRGILLDVIAIEAKVRDWQHALTQAGRNTVFAHRSFVALPGRAADRALSHFAMTRFGLGVVAVDAAGEVQMKRDASRRDPRVWIYYYRLAQTIAKQLKEAPQCHSS